MEAKHTQGTCTYGYGPSAGFGCGYGKSQIAINGKAVAGIAAVEPDSGEMYEGGGLSKETLETVEANARRFVAAWNACQSIPTAALESGVVGELVEALEMAKRSCEADPSPEDYHDDPLWITLEAALAKAKGGA